MQKEQFSEQMLDQLDIYRQKKYEPESLPHTIHRN